MPNDDARPPQETRPVERTCIGCRTRRPDHTMIRASMHDGNLVVGGRGAGRGAWLCPNEVCISEAAKTKAFSRAFRSKLADAVCADTLLGWLDKPAH